MGLFGHKEEGKAPAWALPEEVNTLLADHQPLHSEYQIRNFIIARSGCRNVWGMYKQCLRELASRKSIIESGQYPADLLREVEVLLSVAKVLKEEVGEVTPEYREALEAGYWRDRVLYEAMLDIYLGGRMTRATADLLVFMPKGDRNHVLARIVSIKKPDAEKFLLEQQ